LPQPPPPTLPELQDLAARALERADGDAQTTASWHRVGEREELSVTVTCAINGRAGQRRAKTVDDDGLRRAARAAALEARRPRAWPAAGLPAPSDGRPHDGFDPAVLEDARVDMPRREGIDVAIITGASRVAIASTAGVASAEQRTHAIATVTAPARRRKIRLRATAVAPRGLNLDALADEAAALVLDDLDPAEPPEGDLPVVLGHDAVATILTDLRRAFGVDLDLGSGPLHGRFGTRVAAAAVNLSDSPRYHGTLPRSYDAEGIPRQPVPLIQDGVAHRRVHDSASAARAGTSSTGHATRPLALAAEPAHLVLVGGGAEGVAELCAPVDRGLYVPALAPASDVDRFVYRHATRAAVLVEQGELRAPVADGDLLIDPLAVLASVEALSARSRTLPIDADAPGGPGAAVVPALRAAGGWTRA
jgi:predicted Zn-dependent protease